MTAPDTEPTTGTAAPAVFRTPLAALVAVVFLALSLSPIAFQGHWWFTLLLIPVAIAWWLVRTRTVIDADGLHARTAWGATHWPWSRVATLRLVDRGWVRAVGPDEKELVLRGVRIRDLGRIGVASGGRITAPTPAEAEAAEEHRRELEATRMRIARLREQHPELTAEEAADSEDATAEEPTGDSGERA